MDSALMTMLFFPLFAMAVIWLVMVWFLFRALATRHPVKYEEMGKPSLFLNNNLRSNFRFLKFLFTREPDTLEDGSLSFQVNVMRVWFFIYMLGFVVLIWATTHPVSS
jgi:hypothetical protein